MRKLMLVSLSALMLTSCVSDKVKAVLRKERRTEPVAVSAIKIAETGNVVSTRLVGRVEASKVASVSSQWPGTVVSICVKKGQKVEAGKVLAILDAQSVKSAYDIAKANYDQASDALERIRKVYSDGSVSEVKMLDIKTSFAKAKASLESAEKSLEDCKVKAPFSGVVSDIFVEEGMQLNALSPIVGIMDNSTVEIHASIPENEYSFYPVGTGAVVEIPAVAKTAGATLAVKGVQASALSHSYDLCFKLNGSSDGIMPGMTCKVRLLSGNGSRIVIPASAVKTDGQGRYVWCIENASVSKRHITVGDFASEGVVVEGLEAGDTVIVDGARKVSSGMKDIKVTLL